MKQKLIGWLLVYNSIAIFGMIAIQTSTSPFAAFPSILITFIAVIAGFKIIGKIGRLEKQEKVENQEREIEEQERRAKVESFYKK